MSVFRTLSGVMLFIVSIAMSLYLLLVNKIQGTEFVALIVAFIVVSILIVLLPNVQEISIGTSLVKLNKAKEESDQIIQDLRDTRLEMFRFLLKDSLNDGSFWASDALKDSRVEVFLRTYNKIVDAKCKNELKEEINKTLRLLTENQSKLIKKCSSKMFNKFDENETIIAPQKYSLYLNDEIVSDFNISKRHYIDYLQAKAEIIEAINVYSKIYVVYMSEFAN